MDGYWRLEVTWPPENLASVDNIDLSFYDLDHAIRVLKKYSGYTAATIRYVEFDDPSRW